MTATGPPSRPGFLKSLSGRLLVVTILVVLLAEIVIYVPTVAREHRDLLSARIAAAQTAALALEEAENNEVSPRLRRELLANAGVRAVALKRDETRRLYLADENLPVVAETFDLRAAGLWSDIAQAAGTILGGGTRTIRILDTPRLGGGQFIEAIADDGPLRAELLASSWRILVVSVGVALAAGTFVFLALNLIMVRPIRGLIGSMLAFREKPDDAARILKPSGRRDEIGAAEEALAAMQDDVRNALNAKTHLAALGTAVAKISHDLRNILTAAQLASERLGQSADPETRRQAARLIRTLDRAAALAEDTLAYGRAEDAKPVPRRVALADLVNEAAAAAGARDAPGIAFANTVGHAATLIADPDMLFRSLLNLLRNAVQALAGGTEARTLSVSLETENGEARISVADTGPGIPESVLPGLFEPFGGGAKVRGTGLGLAIARELTRAQGGDLVLIRTGPGGTLFRIQLPQPDTTP
jgi:signal transduction histidine kinase